MISENQVPSPQSKSRPNKAPLSPCLSDALEIKKGWTCFLGKAMCLYSQKHHMMIACPNDGTVQFYDATTLLPLEGRETLELWKKITAISCSPETDFCIMGCYGGDIFVYNASSQTLKRLQSKKLGTVLAIAQVDHQYYAFSLSFSQQIHVGNLERDDLFSWNLRDGSSLFCLHSLTRERLLISGLSNGSIVIYRTHQLPKLQIISLLRPESFGRKSIIEIGSARISKKEYIITYGEDETIRIWNFIKGRMRLIRTIVIGRILHNLIYLEDYKFFAIKYEEYPVLKFISLISGQSKSMFHLEMSCQKFFMMKDKNTLGVLDGQKNRVQLVKLNSS